jgi:epoxide hydrolase 4
MNVFADINFHTADVGEVSLHYATAGTGEQLVVLLHGFPEFWYSWRHQLRALSGNFTVVAADLRGYNLSGRPTSRNDYTTEKISRDVIGLVRELGHNDAHIVGHDWGAAIAWNIAAHHPGLVRSVTAMQVPPPAIWRRNQSFKQLMASGYMLFFQLPVIPEWILSRNDFALLARSLETTTARAGVFTDEDIRRYKDVWSMPGALTAMLNYYRANVVSRLLRSDGAQNESIKVPTLFIYAEKDAAILPETVAGVGSVVQAEYREHRIPNCGHWVQQEAAEEVNQVLRDFLSTHN